MNKNLIKLNKNYNSDTNIAQPSIKLYGTKLFLNFDLNNSNLSINSEQRKGEIVFLDCLMFRSGNPNDEGFYYSSDNIVNTTQWTKKNYPDIQFDSFYQVENSDWQTNFGPDAYINESMNKLVIDKSAFRHYVFFMKEGTFECVAKDYQDRSSNIN